MLCSSFLFVFLCVFVMLVNPTREKTFSFLAVLSFRAHGDKRRVYTEDDALQHHDEQS